MFSKNPFKPLLLVSAITLGLSACNGSDNNEFFTPSQDIDYQQIINEAVEGDLPGVILAIESPEMNFVGSAGVSNLTTLAPMQIDDVMPTGSSGKKQQLFLSRCCTEMACLILMILLILGCQTQFCQK